MKRKIIIHLVIIAFVLGSFVVEASAQSPIRKLGRGAANILTAMLEVPKNIVDVAESDGPIAAITYGVAKGGAMTVLRTFVGAYEVATFIIPFPSGYEPIIEPEFLMGEENY